MKGFEGRLECAPIGEPLRMALPLRLPKACFMRGGPIIEAMGLLADFGRRSCCGDSMKHSPKLIEVDVDSVDGLLPAPNLKGGSSLDSGI